MYTPPPRGYPSRIRPPTVKSLAIGLIVFVLVIFTVDRLVLNSPPAGTPAASLLDRLQHHGVKRVTVVASQINVELNDGTTEREPVPPDRDLWPALQRSGADIAVVRGAVPESTTWPGAVLQFLPIGLMALLVLFILRRAQRNPNWPRQP